jgi:hypothetical protein
MNVSPDCCLQALCHDCEPVCNDLEPGRAFIRTDHKPEDEPVCKPASYSLQAATSTPPRVPRRPPPPLVSTCCKPGNSSACPTSLSLITKAPSAAATIPGCLARWCACVWTGASRCCSSLEVRPMTTRPSRPSTTCGRNVSGAAITSHAVAMPRAYRIACRSVQVVCIRYAASRQKVRSAFSIKRCMWANATASVTSGSP